MDLNVWTVAYQSPIYYSNFVLDYIDKVDHQGNDNVYNSIKGSALFYRAFAFLELAHLYCKPYSSTASTDPGIVMRLTSSVLDKSYRPSVEETYKQITGDLKMAVSLIPETTDYPTQPNKTATYGTLARAYLYMRDYENAGKYADSALSRYHALLDFNTVTPGTLSGRFTNNPEIVYFSQSAGGSLLQASYGKIDSDLYRSYDDSDLRKTIFFEENTGTNANTYHFRGGYGTWTDGIFDGITTAELYLIRSECAARAGNVSAAMADLNTLMQMRWKNTNWVPFTASTPAEALTKILAERRKELVYRGQRWPDVRRLNLEGANITFKRIINGTTYTLPPNDLRWVLLIPQNVIELSGVQQNPR
jgi:hypothetical protein